MSTQDPSKDIRRILGLFYLSSKDRPKFKGMEVSINQNHAEINKRMLGTENYPCPDIDHLIKVIGDGEPNRKFIDWLWRRRGIPALTETINNRMASGQPSFLREMLNPGERVDGGNDDDQQDLRNQIAALTGRNTTLNAQHAEATGKLQEERRTSAQHLSEIASLRRELASLKTDTEAARVAAAFVSDAKVAGLEADKRSLQERISRLEERISGLEKEKADLVKKAEKTDAQLKEQQENLDGLESLIEELTLEKNAAKDATRVNDDENAGAKKAEGKDMKEEESHDEEDEEASDGNDDVEASDGNEDGKGKQDARSLLSSTVHILGNAAADAASGAVGFVTKGVAKALAHAFNTKPTRYHPYNRTHNTAVDNGVKGVHTRTHSNAESTKDNTAVDNGGKGVHKRTLSNAESTKDGDAGSSHEKKPRRA